MFRSKIDAAAQALGVEVAYVSSMELVAQRCAEIRPSIVFVDLSEKNFEPARTMAMLRESAPDARVIGFASHVDLKALAGIRFREAWAGLRPATADYLPVLGPSPTVSGLYYAAGHFRSGILLSAITGQLVAAMVTGSKLDIDLDPFSPARFKGRPAAG